MRKKLLTAFLALATGHVAHAQWSAQVTGPDVFGNTTVVASVDDEQGDSLVVQCNQKDSLEFAFLTSATPSEMDELSKTTSGVPASLLVKVDDGQVIKFDAALRVWNSSYVGVATSGRSADIAEAVAEMSKASNSINVGIEISGNQQSAVFSVENSTSSLGTAIKDCDLGAIQPDPSGSGTSSQ